MLDETSGHFLRNCLEFGATTNNLRSPMDKLKTQTPWSSWKVSCANMMLTGKIIPQGYIPHLPIQLTKSQDAAIEFTIIVPSMVKGANKPRHVSCRMATTCQRNYWKVQVDNVCCVHITQICGPNRWTISWRK